MFSAVDSGSPATPLSSGPHESAGERQRRQQRPRMPSVLGPSGPSCLSSDSTGKDHWCSLSPLQVASLLCRLHSGDSET